MANRLICGDCLKVPLRPNHFDTLITDPPYGLGFMGKDWDAGVPGKVFWKKFLGVCKPGAFAFVFGGTRTFHRLTCAIEDAGWEIRDCMVWLYGSGFPKSLDISKAIDKTEGIWRGKAGVIKTANVAMSAPNYERTDKGEPVTGLAKQWDGHGTALKPAWEPIIIAMKPLDGTFAQNAEKWGTAGLWIDGGRIKMGEQPKPMKSSGKGQCGQAYNWSNTEQNGESWEPDQGRWPANVILDEEAGAVLDEQSSGVSRFFYCAKASKKERNEGLDELPDKQMYKCDDSGQSLEIFGATDGGRNPRKNNHPTVKPLALMEYLCKLSRPPQGGIVFDPFAGSGTTALACMNTDRQYVAIEKEREYCEITAARLGGAPIEFIIPQRPRL